MQYKYNSNWDRLDKVFNFGENSFPSNVYFFPDQLARLWVLISVLATPYIVWLLIKMKKFGWVATFIALVVLPYVFMARAENPNVALLGGVLATGLLVLFHFLLKNSYKNWREPLFISEKNKK